MKKMILHSIMVMTLVLINTGCGGSTGASGANSLVLQSVEASGSNCINGGIRIDSGIDSDRDGNLSSDEVTQTSYICDGNNGTNGIDGADGSDGNDGTNGVDGNDVLVIENIEAKGLNCSSGGIKIDAGLDSDGDGNLSTSEITRTFYVCNGDNGLNGTDGNDGTNGTDGADGQNGIDGVDGSDGVDGTNGIDGVDGSSGLNALVVQSIEANGSNCSSGGIKVDTGIDSNGDGNLSTSEISQTLYVCNGDNGTDGMDGTDGQDGVDGIDGTDGADGKDGVDGTNGVDGTDGTNGVDGSNGVDGIDGTDGVDGTNGLNALVVQSVEANGSNCTSGGVKIDTGIDSDGDGNLSISEIAQTSYVCNGSDYTPVVTDATPILTVLGDNPATVSQGTSYADAGAIAYDANDGFIVVSSSGSVDTTTIGSYSIRYFASDSDGNEVNATRTINVIDTTAPTIFLNGNNPTTINQGETYSDEGASATDNVDENVSVVTLSNDVDTDTAGTYSVVYTASDAAGNEVNATRTVIVENVAPSAEDQNHTVARNSLGYSITLSGSDVGSDTLTYSIVSSPTHGTLTGSGSSYIYTPESDYRGDDSFTYKVNDGTEDSNIATVSLSVEHIIFAFTTQEQNSSTMIDFNRTAEYSAGGETSDITLSPYSDIAYVAIYGGGTQVVDISDLSSISEISTLSSSDGIYSTTLSLDGDTAYEATDNKINIVDVSDPYSPSLIGSYSTDLVYANKVVVSQDQSKAFIADGSNGLVILDISTPSSPTLLGSYNTSGTALDVVLSVDEERIFIADYAKGVVELNVSDPTNPTLLGSYDGSGSSYEVVLSSDGNTLYVTDVSAGMRIFDVSTPGALTLLSQVNDGGYTYSLVLSADETKVYLGNYYTKGGLKIVDISDPNSPIILASYNDFGYDENVYGIDISNDGTKAFVAMSSLMAVYDISHDYVAKSTDFGSDSIKLRIASENEVPLSMSVSADRSDIITVGSYETTLAYDDYNGVDIEIPISSISSATGLTTLTVTLSYEGVSVTRTVYVEVL